AVGAAAGAAVAAGGAVVGAAGVVDWHAARATVTTTARANARARRRSIVVRFTIPSFPSDGWIQGRPRLGASAVPPRATATRPAPRPAQLAPEPVAVAAIAGQHQLDRRAVVQERDPLDVEDRRVRADPEQVLLPRRRQGGLDRLPGAGQPEAVAHAEQLVERALAQIQPRKPWTAVRPQVGALDRHRLPAPHPPPLHHHYIPAHPHAHP